MLKRQIVLLTLVVLPLVAGFGQQGLTNQPAFFWDVRIGAVDENTNYGEIIARSTMISLERAGYKPVPSGDIKTIVGPIDNSTSIEQTALSNLISLAKEQNSSFVILISYYKEDIYFYLEIRAWDFNQRKFYEFKDKARTGLEVYNRLNDSLTALVKNAGRVTNVTAETDTTEIRQPKGYVQAVVLLSNDEGAEIYVNRIMRVGVITDGRLTLPFMPLNIGSKLVIEKRKEGYFNDVEEFELDAEWTELPLRSMEKIVQHEALFIYTIGQFEGFGLGYRYHLIPGKLFLGGENYFFLQTGRSTESHTVIHDDIRALAGLYLVSVPGVPFKIEFSTGIGCIFTFLTIPPNPMFTDFYFNLINICIEFRIWEFVFFIREEMKLGLGIGNNLLGFNFFFINGSVPIFSFGAKIPF